MTSVSIPNHVLLPEVERLLREGHSITLRTRGYSMLPFIIGGLDSVVLHPLTRPLQPGHIVLARIGKGQYVLHRIIRIDYNRIILMGDGNLHGHEICHPKDICGKVYQIIRPKHRPICPDTPHWKRISRLWQKLRPIRRLLLATYRRTLLKKYVKLP